MAKHKGAFEFAPGYEADHLGRIWSTLNWRGCGRRKLTPKPNGKGYLKVVLSIGGKRINKSVHSLIAISFLPPRPSPSHEIRHLDGNPLNNKASNLAWGTSKDNADDRERHGRTSRGRKHGLAVHAGHERSKLRRKLIARAEGEETA